MADVNSPAAAQPASAAAPAAAQPAQQSPLPQGYRSISDDDYNRLTRAEQQAQGFRPLYDRLSKSGIKSEKDWDNFEPIVNTARQRKLDAKAFASMFSDAADDDLSPKGQKPDFDPEEFKKSVSAEARREAHMLRHEDAVKGEEKLVESLALKLLGDGEHDDYTRELSKRAISAHLESLRTFYPDEHPLRNTAMAPLSEKQIAEAEKYWTELRAKSKGADMAEKAKLAAQGGARPTGKVGTVGGGGGAPPGRPNTTDTGRGPDGKPTRAALQAELDRRQQLRAIRS